MAYVVGNQVIPGMSERMLPIMKEVEVDGWCLWEGVTDSEVVKGAWMIPGVGDGSRLVHWAGQRTVGIPGGASLKERWHWHFCVDYQRLNAVTRKDAYQLPRMDDVLELLRGVSLWTWLVDIGRWMWQARIDPRQPFVPIRVFTSSELCDSACAILRQPSKG